MRYYRKLSGLSNGFKNILSILIILSLSFVLINCGQGPESKVGADEGNFIPVDNGDWAINFSTVPPNTGTSPIEVSNVALGQSVDSMAGMEFTVEAWIYSLDTVPTKSAIFFRGGDYDGFSLHLFSGKPTLAFKWKNRAGSTLPILWAQSAAAVANNTWVHVAGVFTKANHLGVHPTCTGTGQAGAEDDATHSDIYVNGVWVNCGSTEGRQLDSLQYQKLGSFPNFTDNLANPMNESIGRAMTLLFTNWGVNGPTAADKNFMIIDDVRFWGVARTATQISTCRTNELVAGFGDCGEENAGLLGYWKFDEGGAATTTYDFSPKPRNGGSIQYCDFDCGGNAATSIYWDCDELAISNPGVACANPRVDLALPALPPSWHP